MVTHHDAAHVNVEWLDKKNVQNEYRAWSTDDESVTIPHINHRLNDNKKKYPKGILCVTIRFIFDLSATWIINVIVDEDSSNRRW